jgi:phage terminase small subunit
LINIVALQVRERSGAVNHPTRDEAGTFRRRMASDLTPKQEKFARKYVELGNASEAYRQSYDAENMSNEAIHQEAYQLTTHPQVSLRIFQLQELARKRHQVTVDRVVAEYAKLAFLDVRKAFDEEGRLKPIHEIDDDTAAAIAGLEVESLFEGRGEDREQIGRLHKLKLADKKGALDSLAKYLKMFADANVSVNLNGLPLPEQDKAMLDEYAKAD